MQTLAHGQHNYYCHGSRGSSEFCQILVVVVQMASPMMSHELNMVQCPLWAQTCCMTKGESPFACIVLSLAHLGHF